MHMHSLLCSLLPRLSASKLFSPSFSLFLVSSSFSAVLRGRAHTMPQTYKSDTEHSAQADVSGEDVPSRVSRAADDIFTVYTSKSTSEQTDIIDRLYSANARFVDPLMAVQTPREISLAFLSLQKLFQEVRVQQKSTTLNPKPRLPADISPADTQQYIVNNQQTYYLARSNAIARCLLPSVVDLNVSTYLTFSQESGRVLYHEDVWENNSFRFPNFLKPGNGTMSSWAFKAAGWGKEVDHAKFARS